MGFTYNDTASADMGIKARLTSWQVCGALRNSTATIPGKYGVADFGADFDYREITVNCSIPPKRNFGRLSPQTENWRLRTGHTSVSG